MDEKKLAECLQPFVQADMSWGRSAGSLGLGLPIARFIAEAHGGELVCKTAPGQGMIATLKLPIFVSSTNTPHRLRWNVSCSFCKQPPHGENHR